MMSHELLRLQIVMETAAEDALTAFNHDSEHRVWHDGGVRTYVVCEDTPPDRSVILESREDGKRYRVSWHVQVDELPDEE